MANKDLHSLRFPGLADRFVIKGFSDNAKTALLNCFEHVAWTDVHGAEYVTALENALYENDITGITAVYTQSGTVYDTDTLNSLKSDLVVTATYSDSSTQTVTDYTLSGTLTAGTSTITVSYGGYDTTFTVTVTHQAGVYAVTNTLTGCTNSNSATSVTENASYSATISASSGYTLTGATVSITMGGTDITSTAYSNGTISIASVTGALVISVAAVAVTLSSISAVYTQSGTVYDTDSLDSLKSDLVVTATYSDSSTATVAAANYTLSGTLTAGTSTITVSYSGKTTTFTVTVTESPYTLYDYIQRITAGTGVNVSTPVAGTILVSGLGDLNALSYKYRYKTASGYDTSNSGVALFGGRSVSGSSSSVAFYVSKGEKASTMNHGVDFLLDETLSVGSIHTVELVTGASSPSTFSVDETYTDNIAWTNSNVVNVPFAIFVNKVSTATNNQSLTVKVQLGAIEIKNASGNSVATLVPAVRKADDVIGMYDTVNDNFYTTSTASYATIGNSGCVYEVGSWS